MKKIFKKNQVIITALALMICAAGYLQFSDAGEEADNPGENGGYEYTMSDNDQTGIGTKDSSDGVTVNVGALSGGADVADGDTEGGESVNVSGVGTETADADADEKETDGDNHQVGEAVMVSTTLNGNFTTNARLVREQRRAQSNETLMAIIDNEALNEEQKQSAVETLVNLTTIAEKENAAELLLEAKGFLDAVVNIVGEEVDVVINATEVTDRQIAQIEDIVMRKTGAEAEHIVITAAVQED